MSVYQLVASDIQKCISGATRDDLDALANEIVFRIDMKDPNIDSDFMVDLIRSIRPEIPFKSLFPSSNPRKAEPSNAQLSPREQAILTELRNRPLSHGEEPFPSDGVDFEQPEKPKYGFAPKFKPRKPVFHNIIQKGVVWNKYAQAHFDEQNPPPSQIIGYKFNIIYCDLLDASSPPRYKVEPSSQPGALLLRFIAGPPYEDAVFRISNKEWDVDRRSGFTCTFERGILQLHFVFRKERYRR
jgi:hypothetical protein